MRVTAKAAAIALLGLLDSAVCAAVQTAASFPGSRLPPAAVRLADLPGPPAAAPFEEIPLSSPARRSYVWAYTCLASGALFIAGSFVFADRANREYERYLAATEPAEIARLYDRTVLSDRLSSGTLLGGEALIAAGLYLRFLRHGPGSSASPVSIRITPRRCALAWRF